MVKASPKSKLKKRPTKRGDDFQSTLKRDVVAICENIKNGHCATDAARLARVNPRTWEAWLHKSREGVTGYEWIVEEHDQATVFGIDEMLGKVRAAASDDWRAAAWVIERRGGATWQKPQQIALTGGLDVNLSKMTDAELDAELRASEAELKQLEEP